MQRKLAWPFGLASRSSTTSRLAMRSLQRRLKSSCLEELIAFFPVARAKLIGLQRVKHAEYFLRIAADAHVVDRNEANYAFGVDNERRAQRHPFLLIEHAERRRQLALDVREHRERKILQVRVVIAPGQMHEFTVDRHAVNHRVTIIEFRIQLAKRGNLRRTDEREVL